MADPFDCGPFLPDPSLVVTLAEYISEVKPVTDMVMAMAILRKLYDLGIELPTALNDGADVQANSDPPR